MCVFPVYKQLKMSNLMCVCWTRCNSCNKANIEHDIHLPSTV